MTRRAPRAVVLLLVLVSCRTATPPGAVPFPPLMAGDPVQAWEQLGRIRESFRGARAFGTVRAREGTKVRSFRVSLRISALGVLEADVLSPLGTVAARILAEGDRVTIDGQKRSIADLVQLLGLPRHEWTSYDLSLLLLGVPPEQGTPVGNGRYVSPSGRFEYDVAPTGLVAVTTERAEVRYIPPSFPPKTVTFQGGEQKVEIEFLELLQQ